MLPTGVVPVAVIYLRAAEAPSSSISAAETLGEFPHGHPPVAGVRRDIVSTRGRNIGLPLIAASSALSFGARPAFGDPGFHLIVIVGEVVFGDVVGGGGPDAVMPENVAERLVEMLGGVRPSDIVRMQ